MADDVVKQQCSAAEADALYFNSYDDIIVHKTMLSDTARVLAYKQFIECNPQLFADKIVVDVGCGTGILSLFAASNGAKHVYAIEAAKEMSVVCSEIIDCNGYSDRITVLSGRAEDVQLPDGVLADVLISEWMGFYLLHESMLDSVIAARDRLLRPGGAIFPSTATIYSCPVSLKEFCHDKFEFWRNVYGFDLSPAGHLARQCCLTHPEIMEVSKDCLLSEPQSILNIDLQFVGTEDIQNIMTSLDFTISRNDVLHGFALWFDVTFDGSEQIVLDTGPAAPPTHWKQTVVLLPDALLVNKASQLTCRLVLQQAADTRRRYNITVELPDDDDDEDEEENSKLEEVCMETGPNTDRLITTELQHLITDTMDKIV